MCISRRGVDIPYGNIFAPLYSNRITRLMLSSPVFPPGIAAYELAGNISALGMRANQYVGNPGASTPLDFLIYTYYYVDPISSNLINIHH